MISVSLVNLPFGELGCVNPSGVPLPIFYGEDGEPIITPETTEHVAQLFAEHGSNIWFEREAKDLLPEGFTHPSSPNGKFT
jgi:isoleucyl-tRNA synthetase